MANNNAGTAGNSQASSKNGNTQGSLWASEYKSWKDGRNEKSEVGESSASGSGSSTASSSSSSNRLNWDKLVKEVFKEREGKK